MSGKPTPGRGSGDGAGRGVYIHTHMQGKKPHARTDHWLHCSSGTVGLWVGSMRPGAAATRPADDGTAGLCVSLGPPRKVPQTLRREAV
jgi:hypothetical protein